MRHPRLVTYAFVLGLLLVLAVPGVAAASPVAPPVAVDDRQSYDFGLFTADETQAGAEFGYSVASDGRFIVVGARYETVGGFAKAGAVYVFARDSLGATVQLARLTAPEPAANERFGQAVAIREGTIVVGAPYDATKGDSAGAVYVYGGTENRWNLEAKLFASDAQQYDRFGDAVATHGDALVVGARGRYSNAADPSTNKTGAAYVFKREFTSWSQEQKLTDVDGGPYHEFGASVGMQRDGWLFVGAPGDTDVPGDATGKVCVYMYGDPVGSAGAVGASPRFNQLADLAVTGLSAGDKFGSAISLFEAYDDEISDWLEHLVVSSAGSLASWPLAPKAYEYQNVWASEDDWTFVRELSPADPGPMGAFTGSAAAFTRRGVFVGMNTYLADGTKPNAGAVMVYGPAQELATEFETPLTVEAPGVLANDFFWSFVMDGYAGWTASLSTQPAHGAVTLGEDGGFTYTPDGGFWGTDSFTYTFAAESPASNAATVTITVEEPGTYTLSYAADAHGAIQGEATQTVHQGEDGTAVTAVPDEDYHFVEWSDGVTTATRQDEDVQEDITVTASFAPDRTEVALSAPIGIVRPAVGHGYLYAGTMSPKGSPGKHQVKLVVQRKADGVWKAYRSVRTVTKRLSASQTKYVVEFTFGRQGAYRLRGELSSSEQYGRSSWMYLRTKH